MTDGFKQNGLISCQAKRACYSVSQKRTGNNRQEWTIDSTEKIVLLPDFCRKMCDVLLTACIFFGINDIAYALANRTWDMPCILSRRRALHFFQADTLSGCQG